ncbi:ABC transporter ATP-binding protein [Chelativorans sp. M5D2P16]|uniref:ABC transporter ATP-binding protein n=1 Tax=Chelativorans sp. M5D2P16 TaxID=3095678 RepID=UPI002ACAEA1B|nr:ABC transporter ATP-binding protein [Chelativorans sp. M5D2P16]MDZ5696682.1 ABC transporter ATP-binding protein [Chelativorans sp. M5D2P16]
MARLTLKNVEKSFGSTHVLRDVSLDVEDGEFVSLVGHSGCGKSTLLRIIARLETPDAGDILIGGRAVNALAPKHRNIAMVFQDYALYPHMTVAENMSMPLVMARLPMRARLPLIRFLAPAHHKRMPEIKAHVRRVAAQLQIEHLLDRRPAQLSGGQRQRVALGRALVRDPQVFLMDEPLSNLDAKLRVQVRKEISELHASSGLTFVYVTHDQVEAMTMSDRVALMRNGRILQFAPPNRLYADPDSIDVAQFIGSPEINTLRGLPHADGIAVGEAVWPIRAAGHKSGALRVGIRPEAISVSGVPGLSSIGEKANGLQARLEVRLIEDLGPEVLLHGRLDFCPEEDVRVRAQKGSAYGHDDTLRTAAWLEVSIDPERLLLFDEQGRRLAMAGVVRQRVKEEA